MIIPNFAKLVILATITMIGAAVVGNYYHEQAHVQINSEILSRSSTVNYGLMVSTTKCVNCTDVGIDKQNTAREYHAMNEIIGYNLFGIMYSIIAGAIIISYSIMLR